MKEVKELTTWISMEQTFKVEETASKKALRIYLIYSRNLKKPKQFERRL